jgi:large subunit ribosomal protein L24
MSIKPIRRQKRWEKPEIKPSGLPVRHKMHVKVGDTVLVIAGSDKGKVSEVTEIDYIRSKIICKDVNIQTKHIKPASKGEQGQIVKEEGPIHSSKVMLYSNESKVASRVGHKVLDDGRKVRYLIKTGEVVDQPGDWDKRYKQKAVAK